MERRRESRVSLRRCRGWLLHGGEISGDFCYERSPSYLLFLSISPFLVSPRLLCLLILAPAFCMISIRRLSRRASHPTLPSSSLGGERHPAMQLPRGAEEAEPKSRLFPAISRTVNSGRVACTPFYLEGAAATGPRAGSARPRIGMALGLNIAGRRREPSRASMLRKSERTITGLEDPERTLASR